MKSKREAILERLVANYSELDIVKDSIVQSYEIIKKCYENDGKVLVCGNGGSASDSEHIVGELMKGFIFKRPVMEAHRVRIEKAFPEDADYLCSNLQGALPAISLVSHTALSSAFINDVAPDMVYAQQVYGYGRQGDVLIGLSTSGNSRNVVNAVKTAKAFYIKTIGFTGKTGGEMAGLCDVTIRVPALETYRIQELHLPIYHALCEMVESALF